MHKTKHQLKEATKIKVKRLYLVTGDIYENVEIQKEVPDELKANVPVDFIGVKADTSTVFISQDMIVSIELETAKLKTIFS